MASPTQLRAAILVVSDTASRDPQTDRCIPALEQVFAQASGAQWAIAATKIVPDGEAHVQRAVTQWTDADDAVNLVITSGGTGFAQRDCTPEAIAPLLHRHAPGLIHGMLASSLSVTPFALMARPVAGVRHGTLIVTLPGSPKGATENLESIIKLLPHACVQAAGADSRLLHARGVERLEQDAGVARGAAQAQKTGAHDHSHHHHGHGHHHHGHKIPKAHTIASERPQPNDPLAGAARRARQSPYPMLTVPQALQLIHDTVPAPLVIQASVGPSLIGHVLAADVQAAESVPAFRASIVDGYAVRVPPHGPSTKGVFPMAFTSHAQAGSAMRELQAGEIARITTGAPLPPGADAVVMVEDTAVKTLTRDGKEEAEVEILTDAIKAGENVREVGSDVMLRDTVLRKGEGISAIGGELGLLASVGVRQVDVYRRPVVGVLSTGDEIVPHDKPGDLLLGEVRDTNRLTLLTALRAHGFDAVDLGIASDKSDALEATLRAALTQVDLLITSGGVSMGELDLLKPTIERALGGTIHMGRVAMKPGKPTTFATVPAANLKDTTTGARASAWPAKVLFALPGNPASAVVTLQLFVLPALHRMSGVEPGGLPRVRVRLDAPAQCDAARDEYQRVVVAARGDGLWATSTGAQRSSRIGSFKGANALVHLPAGGGTLARGHAVDALLMDRPAA